MKPVAPGGEDTLQNPAHLCSGTAESPGNSVFFDLDCKCSGGKLAFRYNRKAGLAALAKAEKVVEPKVISGENCNEKNPEELSSGDNLVPTEKIEGEQVEPMISKKKPVLSDPEVWFRDVKGRWWFVTKTFSAYYRLLIAHLGVPRWQ